MLSTLTMCHINQITSVADNTINSCRVCMASRIVTDTPSPQSATLHHVAVATTHFPSRWGQEAELAWTHSRLSTSSRLLAVDRLWVEPATSHLQIRYSNTIPLHPPTSGSGRLLRHPARKLIWPILNSRGLHCPAVQLYTLCVKCKNLVVFCKMHLLNDYWYVTLSTVTTNK